MGKILHKKQSNKKSKKKSIFDGAVECSVNPPKTFKNEYTYSTEISTIEQRVTYANSVSEKVGRAAACALEDLPEQSVTVTHNYDSIVKLGEELTEPPDYERVTETPVGESCIEPPPRVYTKSTLREKSRDYRAYYEGLSANHWKQTVPPESGPQKVKKPRKEDSKISYILFNKLNEYVIDGSQYSRDMMTAYFGRTMSGYFGDLTYSEASDFLVYCREHISTIKNRSDTPGSCIDLWMQI